MLKPRKQTNKQTNKYEKKSAKKKKSTILGLAILDCRCYTGALKKVLLWGEMD